MEQHVIQTFELFGPFAPFVSVLVGVVISVLGVLPSTFVTAANLVYFGLWMGTLLSFIGEFVRFYYTKKDCAMPFVAHFPIDSLVCNKNYKHNKDMKRFGRSYYYGCCRSSRLASSTSSVLLVVSPSYFS